MSRLLPLAFGLIYTGLVAAVGLGEPVIYSSIDESLRADIPIILESGEVFSAEKASVMVGSGRDFTQFNWVQSDYHQRLVMTLAYDDQKGHMIHVMTETPLYLTDIPVVVVLNTDSGRVVKAVRLLPHLGEGPSLQYSGAVDDEEALNLKLIRDNQTAKKIQLLEAALAEVRSAQDELINDYQKLTSENEELKDLLNSDDVGLYQAVQKLPAPKELATPAQESLPTTTATPSESFSIQSFLPVLLLMLIILLGLYKWQQSDPEGFEKRISLLKNKLSQLTRKNKKD